MFDAVKRRRHLRRRLPWTRALRCCSPPLLRRRRRRAVERLAGLDTRLCPFPLRRRGEHDRAPHRRARTGGRRSRPDDGRRSGIAATGRTACCALRASPRAIRRPATCASSAEQLWLGGARHVPVPLDRRRRRRCSRRRSSPPARRRGASSIRARSSPRRRPRSSPRATPAPWGVPAVRPDAHRRRRPEPADRQADAARPPAPRRDRERASRSTIPAGIGQAEPVDRGPGPCPPPPDSRTIGDCAPGHYFTAEVAASQLQTHTSSGILHLQTERPGDLTLGQFFDEWGVRFDATLPRRVLRGRRQGAARLRRRPAPARRPAQARAPRRAGDRRRLRRPRARSGTCRRATGSACPPAAAGRASRRASRARTIRRLIVRSVARARMIA